MVQNSANAIWLASSNGFSFIKAPFKTLSQKFSTVFQWHLGVDKNVWGAPITDSRIEKMTISNPTRLMLTMIVVDDVDFAVLTIVWRWWLLETIYWCCFQFRCWRLSLQGFLAVVSVSFQEQRRSEKVKEGSFQNEMGTHKSLCNRFFAAFFVLLLLSSCLRVWLICFVCCCGCRCYFLRLNSYLRLKTTAFGWWRRKKMIIGIVYSRRLTVFLLLIINSFLCQVNWTDQCVVCLPNIKARGVQ